MERMSHQFFSCTSLTHKKDRAVCCRHFPQNIFCFCNRCGNTYHVIQRISGIMAFLHHLPSKGILTGLLLIKLLGHLCSFPSAQPALLQGKYRFQTDGLSSQEPLFSHEGPDKKEYKEKPLPPFSP